MCPAIRAQTFDIKLLFVHIGFTLDSYFLFGNDLSLLHKMANDICHTSLLLSYAFLCLQIEKYRLQSKKSPLFTRFRLSF